MTSDEKWDVRFLELAKFISRWSKDPSTKCGAVIVRPNRTVVSIGFNGFPRKIDDNEKLLEDREYKYAIVIHAEENALLHTREDVAGCTIYTWPVPPCPRCASKIIQTSIARVVSAITDRETCAGMEIEIGRSLFKQAGIELTEMRI